MTNQKYIFVIFVSIPFLLTITATAETPTSDVFTPKLNFDPENHGKKILSEGKKAEIPHYMKQYGSEGKNYDLDDDLVPFIWCETFNRAECRSTNISDCLTSVKCRPERRNHQLGCMAVFVYNSSETERNMPEILREPALKGCWSQDASELRECNAHDECIVESRKTGSKDRSAQFCCCRTHNCNKIARFMQADNSTEEEEDTTENNPETEKKPNGDHFYTIVFGSITILSLICLSATVLCISQYQRKQVRDVTEQDDKIEPVTSPNMIPMRRLEYNAQCMAVINGKLIDLRNTELKEKISKGRFGEVYRGEIEGVYLAVKLCTKAELDSWVNEQDIYSMKPMRKHDNIAEFVASFEYDRRYWLVTQYYSCGSLYDYLQTHTVSFVECAKIISGFLNGLAFLHEDRVGTRYKPTIIHRDFKSKNVLIKDNLTACISDFGLAMKYDGSTLADELHGQVGTRRYMAPEVLEGATEFTSFAFQQIDVYAAALVMWEVLNRTEISGSGDVEPYGVPEAKLPYETEIGATPTLGPLREYVVLKKMRPIIRPCILQDPHSSKLVNTMTEMWEMEPDARITSGCARDRVIRAYEEVSGVPFKTDAETSDNQSAVRGLLSSLDNGTYPEDLVGIPESDVRTALLERRIIEGRV
ncbi:hypothetical protein FO519_000637 [Halicephalobus sp. NKZ332]|nr:hypothetical protein FO519_000637 [Halicephalobus sp. NKZ332]